MRISLAQRLPFATSLRRRAPDPSGVARLAALLGDHRRYERQIDRLHQRHMSDGGLWTINEAGVGLGSVVIHRTKLARMLARAVSGNPRASAFRSVPYHTIRSRWGLHSTRRSRDRAVAHERGGEAPVR